MSEEKEPPKDEEKPDFELPEDLFRSPSGERLPPAEVMRLLHSGEEAPSKEELEAFRDALRRSRSIWRTTVFPVLQWVAVIFVFGIEIFVVLDAGYQAGLVKPSDIISILIADGMLAVMAYYLGKRAGKEMDYDRLGLAVARAVHQEFEEERKQKESKSLPMPLSKSSASLLESCPKPDACDLNYLHRENPCRTR